MAAARPSIARSFHLDVNGPFLTDTSWEGG